MAHEIKKIFPLKPIYPNLEEKTVIQTVIPPDFHLKLVTEINADEPIKIMSITEDFVKHR